MRAAILLLSLIFLPAASANAGKCCLFKAEYRPIPYEYARYFNPYLPPCGAPKVGFAPTRRTCPRQHYRAYAPYHPATHYDRIWWGYRRGY